MNGNLQFDSECFRAIRMCCLARERGTTILMMRLLADEGGGGEERGDTHMDLGR